MSDKREFTAILTEWTNTLLEVNKQLETPEAIGLVLRLGILGQKLLFESHTAGMDLTVKMVKEIEP